MQDELINAIVSLVFIGKDTSSPSLSEGLPYQHPGKLVTSPKKKKSCKRLIFFA